MPDLWARVQALAAQLDRNPDEVADDLRIVSAMEQDIVLFAEFLFSVGKGWIYTGHPLTEYQKQLLRRMASNADKTLDLIPRGHMKTTLVRIFVLWVLCYKKADNVLVLAGSDDNKQGYRDAIQIALTNHLKFARFHWFIPYFFGDAPIIKDNQDFLHLANGARVFYRSILSKNRGLNVEGRPDLVIMDDIYPDEARTSDAVRDRITDTMLSAVEFLGEAGARYRGVGTPLHVEDFWWKIAKGDVGGWDVRRLEAHDDNFENILWPDRYPDRQAFIRLQEEVYIPLGRMHLYQAELRCNPTSATNTPFATVEFLRYRQIDPMAMFRVLIIDNAGGRGGDNFCVAELGAGPRYEVETAPGIKEVRFDKYILDIFATNIITQMGKFQAVGTRIARRRPHAVYCGATAESRDFIAGLGNYLRSVGHGMTIEEYPETTDKNDRIVGWLEYEYTVGTMRHPERTKENAWIVEYESELRNFDKTRKNQKDDRLDTVSKGVHKIRAAKPAEMVPQPPKDPIMRMLWRDLNGIGNPSKEPELVP